MVYKEDQIAKVIVSYFGKLYTMQEGDRRETVEYALAALVTTEDNERLIGLPSNA